MRTHISEFVVSIAALLLAFVLLNPMNIFMPDVLTMILIGIFFVLFGIFGIFLWRERSLDEREELHRMRAGHTAYLAVSTVLALGIGIQTFSHSVDPWLVIAFAVAILAKVASVFWNRNCH